MSAIDRIIALAEKQAPLASKSRWQDKAMDLAEQAKRCRRTPVFAKNLALKSLAFSCTSNGTNPLQHPVYQEAEAIDVTVAP